MMHSYPTIRCSLDEGAYLPTRAHATDAGADIRTPHQVIIPPYDSRAIDTGVHVELPDCTAGLLVSKSGLNVINAMTSTGLIDQGYTGEIHVRIFNHSPEWRRLEAGEKFTQLVVLPVLYPTYVLADEIKGGDRGGNGIGSTGRL